MLDNPQTQSAIVNSLLYATMAATVLPPAGRGGGLYGRAQVVPWRLGPGRDGVRAHHHPGHRAVGGVLLGLPQPFYGLYGTGALLVLAFVATFLPIALFARRRHHQDHQPRSGRASRILGAGQVGTFGRITLPLAHEASLVSGWMLVFIPVIRELSVAVFLITRRPMS